MTDFPLVYKNFVLLIKIGSTRKGLFSGNFEGTIREICNAAKLSIQDETMVNKLKPKLIEHEFLTEVGQTSPGGRGQGRSTIYRVNRKQIQSFILENEDIIPMIKFLRGHDKFPK